MSGSTRTEARPPAGSSLSNIHNHLTFGEIASRFSDDAPDYHVQLRVCGASEREQKQQHLPLSRVNSSIDW